MLVALATACMSYIDKSVVHASKLVPETVAGETFTVVDPDATVALLGQTGELVPLVIRREESVDAAVVAELEEAFARTRQAFQENLERVFGERILGSREINSARFRTFRTDFQAENPRFPINLVLAQSWAKGYTGEPTLDRLRAAVRQVMEGRLVGEVRPASTVFLASPEALGVVRHWGEVANLVRPIEKGAMVSVEEAGMELRRMLDALDRVAGGFLSGLVRTNVVVDGHLTGLLMRERLGARAVQREFGRGERLPVGERWGDLAIEYARRAGIATIATPAGEQAQGVAFSQERGKPWVGVISSPTAIYLGVGLGAVAVSFVALWRRVRRGRNEEAIVVPEAREGHGLREALLPHLAREMKDKLVSVLFAQRKSLLENEDAASRRVSEMEARLARLQPAIAERIRGYEERIRDLERQLQERDREARELIRAKLVLARRELDDEISRNRLDWN
ncbi:hypothetical protein ASA1KI_17630 [Opitutales bacterium ASA1]|uniref:hypothetical protein n=1 Tax=Congregicoccus parvus TaxID=3081749 RepID=UPI002B2B6051|nr:hypothetical protein ASA1KI_17630 [Opitutales bacterium ASA1]